MTAIRRRPRPPRAVADLVADAQRERDLALGAARAGRDQVASWLAGRADAFAADAAFLDRALVPDRAAFARAVEHELRQALIDFERTEGLTP